MKKKLFVAAMFTLGVGSLFAQDFNLTGEFRPRFENRHGYKTLHNPSADGANFVSQRTRLNFGYKHEKLQAYVSMQNIRVWGDVSTLSKDDNATALHEAWAQYSLTDKVSLKMGRQEIVYDDSRIFGNVGWAQQARSHDAFLVKYAPNANNRLDVGLALNSDAEGLNAVQYSGAAGYKDFQYAWYHGKFNDFGLSVLALNVGKEFDNSFQGNPREVDYMQTLGARLTYKKDKLSANVASYSQMGKMAETDVSALYYAANVGYKITDKFSAALGYEYLSGKDQNDTDADIKTFQPLFGTNHKFNGWMDYFYVGYGNPTGLQDLNATFAYNSGKFSAKLVPHLFSTAADVYNGSEKMDASLGTEIDLNLGYKLSKEAAVNVGYSKMLATDTMEQLKGGDKDANSSWAWVMFTFKPKLFSHKAPALTK